MIGGDIRGLGTAGREDALVPLLDDYRITLFRNGQPAVWFIPNDQAQAALAAGRTIKIEMNATGTTLLVTVPEPPLDAATLERAARQMVDPPLLDRQEEILRRGPPAVWDDVQ